MAAGRPLRPQVEEAEEGSNRMSCGGSRQKCWQRGAGREGVGDPHFPHLLSLRRLLLAQSPGPGGDPFCRAQSRQALGRGDGPIGGSGGQTEHCQQLSTSSSRSMTAEGHLPPRPHFRVPQGLWEWDRASSPSPAPAVPPSHKHTV